LSEVLTNPYRYAEAPAVPLEWFSSGYTGSLPTITTTTTTNDTAAPTGTASGSGGWSRGNALASTTGAMNVKVTGTSATFDGCAIGLCDYTAASQISNQQLALANSHVFAFGTISSDMYVSPQAIYADHFDFVSTDILNIALSDTTLSYKLNGVEQITYEIDAGDYRAFVTSADGMDSTYQFV